jgi:predicted acylesterase/phospholipase RssA
MRLAVAVVAVTVAFAFSGGGNLGPMQAGSVLALAEAGIQPELLVGTSVGAFNAAFLSSRPGIGGARRLMEMWTSVERRQAVRLNPFAALAGVLGMRDHLVSDHQVRSLIARWIEISRFDQATIRLAVTATDAGSGEGVAITEGDVSDAVAASAAIPGLLPPSASTADGCWTAAWRRTSPYWRPRIWGPTRSTPSRPRPHRSRCRPEGRSGRPWEQPHSSTPGWLATVWPRPSSVLNGRAVPSTSFRLPDQ